MPAQWTKGLLSDLIPWFEWILSYVQYYDPSARVTSAFRSRTEQARLYRRWQAGLMPGPVAPPGLSLHEQGRAVDIYTNVQGDVASITYALKQAGAAWQQVGGTWGGAFKGSGKYDPIHFEA